MWKWDLKRHIFPYVLWRLKCSETKGRYLAYANLNPIRWWILPFKAPHTKNQFHLPIGIAKKILNGWSRHRKRIQSRYSVQPYWQHPYPIHEENHCFHHAYPPIPVHYTLSINKCKTKYKFLWQHLRTVYLLISHATRPFSSITSAAVAYPIRRRTRFRHLSSSICSRERFFFSSAFSWRISPATWPVMWQHPRSVKYY